MSVKTAAAKTAKVIVWPIKTPKRLVAWMFVGLAVLALFLYGAMIMDSGPRLLAQASHKGSSTIAGVAHSVQSSLETAKPDKAKPDGDQSKQVEVAPSPPAVPVGRAEWAKPRMRAMKLDPEDSCFMLKGLYHNIYKCWSDELIEGTSISRFIYHMRGAR